MKRKYKIIIKGESEDLAFFEEKEVYIHLRGKCILLRPTVVKNNSEYNSWNKEYIINKTIELKII